jgi:phosphocarrier protein
MKKAVVKIMDEVGLHARPASLFVKEASNFKSEIEIEFNGRKGNAKSIIGVLSFGIGHDQEFTIIANGEDEEAAVNSLVELVKRNFQ